MLAIFLHVKVVGDLCIVSAQMRLVDHIFALRNENSYKRKRVTQQYVFHNSQGAKALFHYKQKYIPHGLES